MKAEFYRIVCSVIVTAVKGASYIFSLRKLDETGKEVPQITIEIVNGEVFQARGKFNRSPTPEEQRIINAWSAANNLIY